MLIIIAQKTTQRAVYRRTHTHGMSVKIIADERAQLLFPSLNPGVASPLRLGFSPYGSADSIIPHTTIFASSRNWYVYRRSIGQNV